MATWLWAVLLLLVGIALTVADVFLPSGGLLAFVAFCTIVAAVVMAFMEGSLLGMAVLAAALLGVPIVVVFALRWWPRTSMGQRVLLEAPTSEDVMPDSLSRRSLQVLVGRVGHAKSMMLPGGIIAVDSQTFDAISDGQPIEPGQRVRVMEVRGNRIVVQGLPDDAPLESDADRLARPVDWDAADPFTPPA